MEEDRESTRYWCHECNLEVDPILEVESVKCSLCHGGFVEEMDSITTDNSQERGGTDPDLDPDRALSLWAPILLGMMNNPRRRRRFQHLEFEDDDEDEDRHNSDDHRRHRYLFQRHREGGESELDRELELFMRRRQRSSATILQLLQDVRTGTISESEERENGERVILINPFNQTIIVQGGGGENPSQTHPIGSLGDYFVGPGLDLLLQQLAENDPNRYGTPPAQKEVVESMPTVTIDEPAVQCSVCLDDFEVRAKAKEMPCKHRFHSKCILPWLELHSSCPVCRFELPADESKLDQEPGRFRGSSRGGAASGSESEGVGNGEDGRNGNGRRFSVSLPWPFNSLFSSTPGSQTGSLMTSTSGSGSGSDSSPRARDPRAGEDGR